MISKLRTWLGELVAGRSFENPAVPLGDPDELALEVIGGARSASGVRVGPKTALTLSAVWAACQMISRDVAKLPLRVFRRVDDGEGRERDVSHPAYNLLRWRTGPLYNAYNFKGKLQFDALLHGNGAAVIHRDSDGQPVALEPVDPVSMKIVVIGSEVFYTIKKNNEEEAFFQNEVLHIRGLGPGLEGLSTLSAARDAIGVGIAASRFTAGFFTNDARPSLAVSVPGELSDKAKENIRRSLEKRHTGVENAFRAMLLEHGMEITPLSVNAEEAELIATRKLSIVDVANYFGVPPHRLGDDSRTSFASLEQENQQYLDSALDPWLANWEHEARDKLMSDAEKAADTHFMQFDRRALMRANAQDRGEFLNKSVLAGWMSRDEARASEGLNPMPDDQGKVFFVPLNVGPAEKLGEQSESEEEPDPFEPPETDEDARAVLASMLTRMSKNLCSRLARGKGRAGSVVHVVEAFDTEILAVSKLCGVKADTVRGVFEDYSSVARQVGSLEANNLETVLEKIFKGDRR